jgi:hypothetical protein
VGTISKWIAMIKEQHTKFPQTSAEQVSMTGYGFTALHFQPTTSSEHSLQKLPPGSKLIKKGPPY